MAIWAPRAQEPPFDVNHSPLFGDVRGQALSLAIVAALLLILGGIGLLVQASWWQTMTIAAAGVSAVLLLVTFSPRFLISLAINAVIIVLATRARVVEYGSEAARVRTLTDCVASLCAID